MRHIEISVHGSLMVRWVVGWIPHGRLHWVISRFSQYCMTGVTKAVGMYYPVCGIMNLKETLLQLGKSSPCGGSGFPSIDI